MQCEQFACMRSSFFHLSGVFICSIYCWFVPGKYCNIGDTVTVTDFNGIWEADSGVAALRCIYFAVNVLLCFAHHYTTHIHGSVNMAEGERAMRLSVLIMRRHTHPFTFNSFWPRFITGCHQITYQRHKHSDHYHHQHSKDEKSCKTFERTFVKRTVCIHLD